MDALTLICYEVTDKLYIEWLESKTDLSFSEWLLVPVNYDERKSDVSF